jgi:hypothetical protein
MKVKDLPHDKMNVVATMLLEAGVPIKDIPEMELPNQEKV